MLPKIRVLATAAGFAAGGWLCLCPPDAADHHHAESSSHEDQSNLPHECRCPEGQPAAAEPVETAHPLVAAHHETQSPSRPGQFPTQARPRHDRARGSPPGQYTIDALYLDHAVLRR